MPDTPRPLHLLLAEDSEDEAYIFQAAFERAGLHSTFYAVRSGEQAIRYLSGANPFDDRLNYPYPTLLILDLKMPGLFDGFDILEWIKEHPDCAVMPTLILTSSKHPEDVRRAYTLGANAYIVKPGSLGGLQAMLHAICEFWSLCEWPAPPPDRKCDPPPTLNAG